MTLTFSNESLTLFDNRNGYSVCLDVPLEGGVKSVCDSLSAWTFSTLPEGETISGVVLEEVAEGISAAISVVSDKGSRTFVVTSTDLPEEVGSALLATWVSLK